MRSTSPTIERDGIRRANDMLRASLHDLSDDFDEIATIAESSGARVRKARADIVRSRHDISVASASLTARMLDDSEARLSDLIVELATLRTWARSRHRTERDLDLLGEAKERSIRLLRSELSIAASLIVATDWQSPSFDQVGPSTAGRFTGLINEHVDDYKRDRHQDAEEFERAYLEAYVDRPSVLPLRVFMTSCGMSAFATILGFLTLEGKLDRPSLVGRSTYHECRDLAERAARGSCLVANETASNILGLIRSVRPGTLFLDSMCNAKGLAVPDIRGILHGLCAEPPEQELFLVLDNSALSCTFQPWMIPRPATVRLLVFESLTKYAQFGLDRNPAGMVVVEEGPLANALSAYREHLGTNVADVAAHAIPRPDRLLLERRLDRIGRNTFDLATCLDPIAESGPVLEAVVYPSLPRHPAYEATRALRFRGGFLSFEFEPGFDRPETHRLFLRAVLGQARRHGAPIAAGPSFGLNVTRIYVTSTSSRAFVRVSPGTEHRWQVERLKRVFAAAIRELRAGVHGSRHGRCVVAVAVP